VNPVILPAALYPDARRRFCGSFPSLRPATPLLLRAPRP